LFVDDDAAIRRSFARSLRRRGFAVDVAASGLEGLRMAQNRRYPAIVTDLQMPGLDGMTMIERYIRKPLDLDGYLAMAHAIDSFWLGIAKFPGRQNGRGATT